MKNKILLIGLILIFMLSLASARLTYWQTKNNYGNYTNNHVLLFYDKLADFPNTNQYADEISGNSPLEIAIDYEMYIKSWNQKSSYNVSRCDFLINSIPSGSSSQSLIANFTFTENDADLSNPKYFITLNDKDTAILDINCYFNNNITFLDMPMEMTIATPTWECKACQLYEWSVQEKAVSKSKVMLNTNLEISDYIKKLFMINYEIVLSLFWLFLISMIFVAIGFIFLGIYWLYLYLLDIET